MIALLQRVSEASVTVDGQVIGSIGRGLMVLVCAEREDTETQSEKLAQKVIAYRIFEDDAGKMNKSLIQPKDFVRVLHRLLNLLLESNFTSISLVRLKKAD